MIAQSVNAAADVIHRAQVNGAVTAAGLAMALESAQMLMSPEMAHRMAELEQAETVLRARVTELEYVAPSPSCTRCYGADAVRFVAEGGATAPCPVCGPLEVERLQARVSELEAQRERRRVRLVALQNDALNMRGTLSPNGKQRKVPMPLGETLTPAVEWLVNRVAELETERHTTNEALDDAVQALRADRAEPAKGPSAAESADKLTALFAPTQVLREESYAEAVTPRVQAMRALLDGQRAAVEDPHDGPLAHRYRVGRDLPETGGA